MEIVVQILGVIGAVLALIGIVVGLVVVVRGSYSKARIEALQGDNTDLRARLSDNEAEQRKDRAKIEVLIQRVDSVEAENILLRELALKAADVEGLKHDVLEQNKAIIEASTEHRDIVIAALRAHDMAAHEAWHSVLAKLDGAA